MDISFLHFLALSLYTFSKPALIIIFASVFGGRVCVDLGPWIPWLARWAFLLSSLLSWALFSSPFYPQQLFFQHFSLGIFLITNQVMEELLYNSSCSESILILKLHNYLYCYKQWVYMYVPWNQDTMDYNTPWFVIYLRISESQWLNTGVYLPMYFFLSYINILWGISTLILFTT